ncbi:MAG TPA: hypothetical protein VEG67_05045 [Myxococcota bacterium]|nr:hypothetical protein [Myxococcota bacterium]
MNPKTVLLASAAALVLAATGAPAQENAPSGGPLEMNSTGTPGKVVGERSHKVTATVKAIDVANREVTLEAHGKTETVVVGPEVRNLDQVHVGDKVVVKYVQGLMMQLQPPGSAPVEPTAAVAAGRAEPGEKPAGGVVAGIQATVTITAIDMKNRIVVFEGPRGNLYQVKAGPEVHLEKAKVGDKFVATYAEAMAVTVEPAKKAKSGQKSAPAKP